MVKTADKTQIAEGENVTFTISVQNFGIDPATNLVVTDVLPTGLSLVSATPSRGTWSNPNWNVGSLTSGQSENITIIASADVNDFPYQSLHLANTASNTQDQTDNNFETDLPTVGIFVNNDFDGDGVIDAVDVDDDNDGILDCTESNGAISSNSFGWYLNSPSGTLTMDGVYDPGISTWFLDTTTAYTFSGISATSPSSALQLQNITATSFDDAVKNGDYVEISFTTADNLVNPVIENISSGWWQPAGGDSFTMGAQLSADGFASAITTAKDIIVTNVGGTYQNFDLMDQGLIALNANTTYTLRIYVYDQIDDSPQDFSMLDDVNFVISACRGTNSDGDGIVNSYDLDADDDGCSDANEAYGSATADGGDGGQYGSGTPAASNTDGAVVSAGYTPPLDNDSNGTPDYQELGSGPTISLQPVDTRRLPYPTRIST